MQYEYNLTAVGVISRFPYAVLGDCLGLDCNSPGAEVEFLKWCLEVINATMTIIPAQMEHDDMITMIGNGSADITIKSVIQLDPRQELVDFTLPIGIMYLGYFVKEDTEIELGDYMSGFRGISMLAVVITAAIVGWLLHLFTKLLRRDSPSLMSLEFFAIAAILKNSNFSPKEPFCSRILVCAWLLFTFLLAEHYGANLRSFLLLTHYRGVHFTNLDEAMDAMEYDGWKMIVNESIYSPFLYCYHTQCTRLRELQNRSLLLESYQNTLLETAAEEDHQFGFGAAPNDLVPHKKTLLSDATKIIFVRDLTISPLYRSYAIRKEMPALLKKLNQAIGFAYEGFPTIRSRYMRPFEQYVDKKLQEETNVLTLDHLEALLQMTGQLLLFSIACIFAEIIYFRYSMQLTELISKMLRYNQPLYEWICKARRQLQLHPKCGDEDKNTVELKSFSYFAK